MAKMTKRVGKKSGRVYYLVDYRDLQGRRRKERFRKERDAKARLGEVMVGKEDGTLKARAADKRLREVVADWRLEHWPSIRPNSQVQYAYFLDKHILPELGERKLRSITIRDAEQLRSRVEAAVRVGPRKNNSGRVSGNLALVVLRAVLTYARKHKYVTDNVASYVKARRRPEEDVIASVEREVLSGEQVSLLLSKSDGMWRAFLMVVALCGLRKSEALGLTWSSIDWSKSRLRVSKQLARRGQSLAPPKSVHSNRWVPMPEQLVHELKRWKMGQLAYLDGAKNELDLCFTNKLAHALHGNVAYDQGLRPALRRAGLPAMGLHHLRHGYGSRLISAGVSPKAVAVAMGDTLATVLKTYVHLLPGDLDAVAAATSTAVFGGRVQGTSSGEAASDSRRIGI